ncbi:mechanosensitive ion channel family protein [Rheinheimera sp. UJ51]|uniref:mechanosensitive ion channel domain-containing protein n=1 Tax=Rheinheimera sp. UJ51 TaxID=2892446 RepID=UPI001E61E8AE|nr:mechanosensitive ion channel domain-containing protein [Rheinheimera sp. UJ51]MCC5451027.1 mechanosensitive ion channel family protein [Rheinheimera sp. UJ51]
MSVEQSIIAESDLLQQLSGYLNPTVIQLGLSVLTVLAYIVISRRLVPVIYGLLKGRRMRPDMNKRALVVFHILLLLVLLVMLSIVWGVDIRGLLVLASSIIAVAGVALFASWSLISNVTAFFILLGQKDFAEGSKVRIIDGNNALEGDIAEIHLFNTVLKTTDNERIIYPNNLIISRPVVIVSVAPAKKRRTVDVMAKAERWRQKNLQTRPVNRISK